jgi:serine/threonine protein kinase
VRIIDFGIAILREPDAESASRITAAGFVLGTPPYMAPEQARGEVDLDARADLFSLGMMTWELLAGVLPFDGTKAIQLLEASLKKDPPAFADRVPGLIVDPLHELFVRKLMARNKEQRFSSARHALDTLMLLQKDPEAAKPALGIMNVENAFSIVSLPDLPKPK